MTQLPMTHNPSFDSAQDADPRSTLSAAHSPLPAPTLYATVVKLLATVDGRLPLTAGRLAHGAFLDLIRAVDPELSAGLHVPNQRRPFTVSPLQGLKRPRQGQFRVKAGQSIWLRFTLLHPQIFATFTRYLLDPELHRNGRHPAYPTIRIGDIPFTITEMLTTPGSHPWAGYTGLSELCRRWQSSRPDRAAREIALELASPTVFSRSSDKNGMGKFMEPFPAPAMFFGSVAAMWNDHMPLALDKQALRQYAEETVVVGLYKLESRMFRYWGHPQIGSTGRITYLLKDKHDLEMIRTLNLLADFSFYSGVGYKTAMGMGQVRRIGG